LQDNTSKLANLIEEQIKDVSFLSFYMFVFTTKVLRSEVVIKQNKFNLLVSRTGGIVCSGSKTVWNEIQPQIDDPADVAGGQGSTR
jgi:hypothetical protein